MDPRNFTRSILFNFQSHPINDSTFQDLKLREVRLVPESHTSIKQQPSGLNLALPAPPRAGISGTLEVAVGRRDIHTEIGGDKVTGEGGGKVG